MIIWGISANSHDAAISVWKDEQILFASHSERYSKIKNDSDLNAGIVADALYYGNPDLVVWYENPYLKTARQLLAGQGWRWSENSIKSYLSKYNIDAPITYASHHRSHAAAGYYTSGFSDATVICVDAIGEFETMSIWEGVGNKLTKRHSQNYPNSIGLWYSAMTQRCGLKPNEEEYILMGMAAYGDYKKRWYDIHVDFFEIESYPNIVLKQNLHRGCKDWRPDLNTKQDLLDIAATTQQIYTELLQGICSDARLRYSSKNLVLMGGCALNCVANSTITNDWDNVWIMPNPGDAGSSIGAVAAYFGEHIKWPGPYLGYDLGNEYPADELVDELLTNKIAGVAAGRAEFGPRALGHRSLLADPRGSTIKDQVNAIKKRQNFRPFAPAILEEQVHNYFEMPANITKSPYMQFVGKCYEPDKYPAIVHVDGTSRIQTVGKNDCPKFRNLLEQWYDRTGCPMLLNTSLNIRGQPMVNDRHDANQFEKEYEIRVCS